MRTIQEYLSCTFVWENGEFNMHPWHAALVLGGGGARGVAHLGVIGELVAAGMQAERIVGVSIGALAGALYAFEPDIVRVLERTREFLSSPRFAQHQKLLMGTQTQVSATHGEETAYYRVTDQRTRRILHRAMSRHSLLPGRVLEDVVDALLPDADIADASIPLNIVTVDLQTGELVVFDKGPVRLAVRASASVPGIFPPVPHENRLLCDVGGICELPLDVARAYSPETLIAVDVSMQLKRLSSAASAFDIVMRMNDISAAMYRERLDLQADLVIRPNVGTVPWFDFTNSEAMVWAGATAAQHALSHFTPHGLWYQQLA